MPSGHCSRMIALWGKEEGQFFSPSKTPDRVYCSLMRSGELRQGAVSPNGVKPQCGDISEGGGALLGQGAERQLWGATTGKSRRLHTWAGRPEKRENEARARAKVRYDEQWLCLRSSAGPAHHGKGDPHFFVPAPASHPSPSSRLEPGHGEGCAKEQHVWGFGWFGCFSLSEGLSYCYLLSGGAAWRLQWGKPRGVTTKEGGCRARGNPSKNKSHWNTPGKQPCYAHRCAPVLLYVKPSWGIVPSSLLSFFILTSHREGWYLSFTERKPAAKSKASKRHHRASGAAKNRFKRISAHASYKHQLLLPLVLYRLNKKCNVQVTVQANFVVSNAVMGSNYCFCGNKKWKWVDFNFFPVTSLWTLWVLCIMSRIFLSSLLKFSLFSKL